MHILCKAGILLSLVAVADAVTCMVQNTIPGMTQSMVCPANFNECLKFTCKRNGGKDIQKGCMYTMPEPYSCETLSMNCRNTGGTPQCYKCFGEMCNSAQNTNISVFISLISLIFVYFYF